MNFTSPHSPSSPLDTATNPRKRQRTACDRCKSRKQRCDGAYPQCSNCARATAMCRRPPEWEGHNQSYTRALEDQVAYLETRLLAVEQQQQVRPQSRSCEEQLPSPSDRPTTAHDHASVAMGSSLNPTAQFQHSVADVVGMLSLGTGNAGAQSYIGSSSGYALATDLGQMVQATVWNKALWLPATPTGCGEQPSPTENQTRRITLQELRSNPGEPPADGLGEKLINTYLTRIHPRFPFLLRADIWEAHRCRHILSKEPDSQQSRPAPQFTSPAYDNRGFALFVLYMVYAIGALNLRLTEDYKETSPEQFYVSAMQHVAGVREADPVHNLEATVLLVLYHLRSESRNGLWHLTGLAMRTVTDIGLHRKASTCLLHPFEAQLRRRLFWSVYALESILAGTLGRPVSLSDCDIDQPLPLAIDEDECMSPDSHDTEHVSQAHREDHRSTNNLSQFVLLSQLHIFEARIQRTVYRVDRAIDTLQPKMHRLIADLELWHHSLPASLKKSEHDRVMLHYYRNIRILLQPFLSLLDPMSDLFRKCTHAAGQVCQIHKQMHRTPEYGHSFVAVHTVFLSGITLLYALWRGKEKTWSFAISNDIRAASCVLSIMGERAPWIRRFRDTFDVMVEATMAVMQEPRAQDRNGEELNDAATAAQEADFSIFEDLHVDHGALDMARELVGWIQR
ncbi:fungal-specific transcription factor domain-containing protein [Boeremia exigua]|uniref:fungal-specific transcription factor domain-containing protein n=1 Tax=Boeremia exigua TaxID=749465 RepID=UPI001E8CFE31|nr:fungal-specific transcription factor domain-containing protein [Boeremia exigua]KAH6629193.1 fungal-specific transcription factor domain-containing protein [Boeremia exigua]